MLRVSNSFLSPAAWSHQSLLFTTHSWYQLPRTSLSTGRWKQMQLSSVYQRNFRSMLRIFHHCMDLWLQDNKRYHRRMFYLRVKHILLESNKCVILNSNSFLFEYGSWCSNCMTCLLRIIWPMQRMLIINRSNWFLQLLVWWWHSTEIIETNHRQSD